jgi:hypothetical protein
MFVRLAKLIFTQPYRLISRGYIYVLIKDLFLLNN